MQQLAVESPNEDRASFSAHSRDESNIRHRQSNGEAEVVAVLRSRPREPFRDHQPQDYMKPDSQHSLQAETLSWRAPPAVAAFITGRRKFLDFLRARVSDDEAEDILQRASVKILERGAGLRDAARAEAWIYRLLRNELTDHYRRAALRAKRIMDGPADLDTLPAREPALERHLCPCAVTEMTGLVPDYAEALRSVTMEGESISGLATRRGISVNNATVRLHRARKALRHRLEARCGDCAGAGCLDCTCG